MGEKKTQAAKRSGRAASGSKRDRLAPGELDKLVLGYMRRHKKDAPHTASAVAKGVERSSGAVANCLGPPREEGEGAAGQAEAARIRVGPVQAELGEGNQCQIQKCRPSECPTA